MVKSNSKSVIKGNQARPTSEADSRAKVTSSCQEFGKPSDSPKRSLKSQARGLRVQTAKDSKSSCSKSAARMNRDLELARRRVSPSMRVHIDVTNSMKGNSKAKPTRTTIGNLNGSMVGTKQVNVLKFDSTQMLKG